MMAVAKIREESVPVVNYLTEVRDGDVSDNQDVQRYFCSDNTFINGIGVTVLTGDYLPPIILGEIVISEGIVQKYIVDAMQRTSALMKIRYGNYKFTSAIEDDEIYYQSKVLDENGVAVRDEDNNFLWEKKSFHLKGHTFDEFPDELKKRFDRYQLRIVTHQNCTMDGISQLIRRYNNHKPMGASQKALTWIPTYARQIKSIGEEGFFKNTMKYSDTDRKNGNYMQLVCGSVMALFHMDRFKKDAKSANAMLEECSNHEEFETVRTILQRMEKCCGEDLKDIFVKKDISAWVSVFDKFTKLNLPDEKFAEFIKAIPEKLHNVMIGDWSYDLLDKEPGTTGKKLVAQKIDTYTALMMDYLHIDTETLTVNPEETTLSFVQENANPEATDEDINAYSDLVDYCFDHNGIEVNAPIYQQCQTALIALMAYACENENEDKFEEWINKYKNQKKFSPSQKVNYDFMKRSFDKMANA